jgi:hypothetical protein
MRPPTAAVDKKGRLMWDLALELEELRDDVAGTERLISILEQCGRQLTAMAGRRGDAAIDLMIERHLDEIAGRMATTLARQASIARMMETVA